MTLLKQSMFEKKGSGQKYAVDFIKNLVLA